MIPTTYKAVFEVQNDIYGTQANDPNATEWQVEVNLGSLMKGDKGDKGDAATVSVGTVTAASGTSASATVNNSGTTSEAVLNFSFTLPKGATGATGTGIQSVAKTSTSGNIDTYTITLTNGQTSTFTVTNGLNGDDGVGIASITKTGTVGKVDTYTVTLTDASTTTFTVTNGDDGNDGRGIRSIAKTSTSGLVDTYTITYTDGTTSTYTITNGQDGTGAGDMTKQAYDFDNSVSNAGGIKAYVQSLPSTAAEEVTWTALKAKRDGGTLTPGRQYRITDYVATTIQNGSQSAEHPFDVIVTALTASTLSEEAKAALHSGDTYFESCKIEAWKIWYCLDNDTTRFTWADTTTGRGVIYRMIDEYNNDVPYDFKGIQFKRYKITSVTNSSMANLIGLYIGHHQGSGYGIDTNEFKWYYTFSKMGNTWEDAVTDASFASYTTDMVFETGNMTNSVSDISILLDNVFAYGPIVHEFLCEEEGITPSFNPKTFFVRCKFEGTDSSFNTMIGWAGLVNARDTFRRNTIIGSFRHLDIGTNCQDNILFNFNDFSFCELNEAFSYNNIYAKIINDTNFGSYFQRNTISADCIYHTSFPSYVTRNIFTDTYLLGVTITGQFLDCTFNGKFMACTFSAICGYCDFKGGTNGNSVVNLDVVGGIRGTAQARVNVENPTDFVSADAQGTKRRIRLEGDTNGNMIISWYSDGVIIRKTKGASGSTWTTLPAYYIKPDTGIPSTDLTAAVQTSLGKADTALQTQTKANWNETDTTSAAYIQNKPTIPTIPGVFDTTTNGLVPAASDAGDTDRFLKGDGTWATPSGSSGLSIEPVTFNSSAGRITGITMDTAYRVNWYSQSYASGQTAGSMMQTGALSIDNVFEDWATEEVILIVSNDAGVDDITLNIPSYFGTLENLLEVYVNGVAGSMAAGFTAVTIPESVSVTFRLIKIVGQGLFIDYVVPQASN